MFRILVALSAILAMVSAPARAGVTTETVKFKAGDTTLVSYIAYDKNVKGKRPAVIVVPDFWGQEQFVRDRANALAKMGYTAITMDVYGNGTYGETQAAASGYMKSFTADPKTMETRFDATHQQLLKHKTVDPKHVAAIGYSLGGMVVLEMVRRGKPLDAVASIWGVVTDPKIKPAAKGGTRAKVLLQLPEKDKWATPEAVGKFKREMAAAGNEVKVVTYPGTLHAFSRPDATERAKKFNMNIAYDEKAANQSWKDLGEFLKTAFR